MKVISKIFFVLMTVLLLFAQVNVYANEHITDIETPEAASLKWATKIGEGWQKPAGAPIFVEDKIVIISGDELLAVSPENGEIVQRATMLEAQSYGYVQPTYADGKIFMNLSNGTVQAFDAKTFESVWSYTDPLGGKGMTCVTYSDKAVFTGFWNGEKKDASFVALDSETGEVKWTKTIDGGLYWAGAYCTDDAVIFGTDDGADGISHIFSCNKTNGEVISGVDVENKGDIRSALTYENGRIYATTKGGYIISALLTDNVLSDVMYGEIGAASTSTPVIYKDRIYIGAGDKTISVFDAKKLEKLFSVTLDAYPQCTPLISTYYTDREGYICLYTTYNKTPGGITLVKIKTDAASAEDCDIVELYDAEGYSQYCISDIICDNEGTLYYKNDSGYLFALSDDKINVNTSFTEEGFIYPRTEVKVSPLLAESYGYTDMVSDGVSALDVLVKIHKEMLLTDFTADTASDYLVVSAEGYLSRVMGVDTYNFGFAVNGKAPHDDVLTDYGYTGYSVNQAAIEDGDTVEFFIYRDDWAMDNYVHFEIDNNDTDKITISQHESVALSLKGYVFAWYSCYDDAQIESMTTVIGNANVTLVDKETGAMEEITRTDSNGNFTIDFSMPGSYIVSAIENDGDSPIIAPWLEIDVKGIDIEVQDTNARIVSNLEEETDVIVYVASYNGDMLTKAILKEVTLYDEPLVTNIDISGMDGDVKVFIWDKSMNPVVEVK